MAVYSGVFFLVAGILVVVLGFASFINYSQTCYVNPGGFPCVDTYQVALLAPLYPICGELMAIGALIVVAGSSLAVLASIADGIRPKASKSA